MSQSIDLSRNERRSTLIETTRDPNNQNAVILSVSTVTNETSRLGNNLLGASFNQLGSTGIVPGTSLVIEANEHHAQPVAGAATNVAPPPETSLP